LSWNLKSDAPDSKFHLPAYAKIIEKEQDPNQAEGAQENG
jgi:hypothetical protein